MPNIDTTANLTNLNAGIYNCTVSDSNNCSTSVSVTISEPQQLSISTSTFSNVSCNGGIDGSITLNTASGGIEPYSYLWTHSGDTSLIETNLSAGTYVCTVSDSNNCSTSVSVTISEPQQLSISTSTFSNVACNGGVDGSITLNTASGGIEPYSYLWTHSGDTSLIETNLSAGTYVCTVSDSNNCSTSISVTISEPEQLSVTTLAFSNVTCNGGNDGSITLNTASGGIEPYSYLWILSGDTGLIETDLSAGTYTCTVSDSNNCSTSVSFTITESDPITNVENISICSNEVYQIGDSTYSISGTYITILQTVLGCDSAVTTYLEIENQIDVSTQISGSIISANNSIGTYQWINCISNTPILSATNQSFDASSGGEFAVIITEDLCTDTSDCIYVSGLGIENENNELNEFSIFPNPSNGKFTLKGKPGIYSLRNEIGQQIMQFTIIKDQETVFEIPIQGMFFVEMQDYNIHQKIIVVK